MPEAPLTQPPPSPGARRRMPRRGFVALVVVLLAVNWLIAGALFPSPQPATIAYSPLFLDQVQAGNVQEISSTDAGAIQGVFRKPVSLPGAPAGVRHFKTQVPVFADDDALSSALAKGNVTVDATPPSTGPGLFTTLLVGFGPVVLLIGAFVWLSRRSAMMTGAGPLSAFTRSRASRRGVAHDVRGCGGNRRCQGRVGRDRRLPTPARALPPPRRPRASRCAAGRTAGHRQDTARPRGGGGRRASRSSRCQRRSSSR
jgi:hypothetical protein